MQMTRTANGSRLPDPKNANRRTLAAFLIVALSAVFMILVGVAIIVSPILSLVALSILCGVIGLYQLIRRPARLFILFLILLPFYQWSLVILFRLSGSNALIALIQPWKELLVFGILALVSGYSLSAARPLRLRLMDCLILCYLGLNLVYLLIPFETSLLTRLFGMRILIMPIMLFLLGRTLPFSLTRQKQVLNAVLLLGIVGGLFALIDRLLLPYNWPATLGLYEFLARHSPDSSIGFIGPENMPWTFWTSTLIRRTSSFFANPLDAAAAAHLLGMTALAVLLTARPYSYRCLFAQVSFGFVLLLLLLSISRASIVAFAFECLIMIFLLRRYGILLFMSIAIGIALIGALFTPVGSFMLDTITLRDTSLQGHIHEWGIGFQALLRSPFGLGPGTSGYTGAVQGTQVGGESEYLIIGVQLGIVGLVLYMLLQVVTIGDALWLFGHSTGTTRILALVTGVSRIGLAMVAFTANIEIYLFSSYLSWWLIGWVHQDHSKRLPAIAE